MEAIQIVVRTGDCPKITITKAKRRNKILDYLYRRKKPVPAGSKEDGNS